MSQDADPTIYLIDAETFSTLKRIARRLYAEGVLAGDERRKLAGRMGALLHKAQPEHRGPAAAHASAEHGGSSRLLKKPDAWGSVSLRRC